MINGRRRGAHGSGLWADNTLDVYPDWVQIDFDKEQSICAVDVFSLQDAYTGSVEPNDKSSGTRYALRNFMVQYWTGGGWVTPAGGTITDNTLIWKRIIFASVMTTRVRVTVNSTPDNYTQVPEIEIWG